MKLPKGNPFRTIIQRLGPDGITKVVLMIILLVFLFTVYHRASAKDVSMNAIQSALKSGTKIQSMEQCDDRKLMQFMGLDHANYKSYLYYKSKEALGVDEVLVIKANQKDDLQAVEDAVEQRIEDQIKTFDGYGPTQVARLKNAVVYRRGNYLFYCVAKHPEQYEEVFKDVI